ncbi:stage II sporulation protein P [Ureibacillus chungkukjangi]|uniref:Stage II sporulation protein P n=1 Tax=Ureibacillus chungkukjangi TaxID=1202712 RepID=A0A318TRI8_9BACL|nr:stage II sporulation protein P [Ureibacillus chungkukjangi]PYF07214.1 stage II sporulation protein P [Ureibacillus chungkukjangi]
MQNRILIFFGFILLLFISPIVVATLDSNATLLASTNTSTEQELVPTTQQEDLAIAEKIESNQLVYSTNSDTRDTPLDNTKEIVPRNALILFTHSHEAFKPIVKSKDGKTAVYDSTSNIMSFNETIKNYFTLNSITADFLEFNTMDEMAKTNRKFSEAYNIVRPALESQINNKKYDIIIDLHRDSANREITTLNYQNETYGKLYFVVGEEHSNYLANKSYAQKMSTQLNELIPGISRGVISKKGDHVDGVYNQDLAENMVLIELGGIDNTEEEINRTLSVLSKAISTILQETLPTENVN